MDESLEVAILSEGTTKKAFEARDWPALQDHCKRPGKAD
jgi:hypothetical protein